jgi:hypothetical protein
MAGTAKHLTYVKDSQSEAEVRTHGNPVTFSRLVQQCHSPAVVFET